MIKVVTKDKKNGWVGLDDFTFDHDIEESKCEIEPSNAVVVKPTTLGDCDFQKDFCDWDPTIPDTGETFHFRRLSGNDENMPTNPGFDHLNDPDGN